MSTFSTEGYHIIYYVDEKGREPVRDYLHSVSDKEQNKIDAYLELLKEHQGYLDEPYSRHIAGKIRELRVDFARNRHRILYFTAVGRQIILLHAFLKKTPKTPDREVVKALERYKYFLIHSKQNEKSN